MTTFALILYISLGFGSAKTGGPVVIDGFKTVESCEAHAINFAKKLGTRYDFHICQSITR